MIDILEKMNQLSPEYQKEVDDFIEFLLEKKSKSKAKQKRLKLSWAGGLKEFKDQYTSLELQKKSLEWWGD